MTQAMATFIFLTALYSLYAGARGVWAVARTPDIAPAQAMSRQLFGAMAMFIGVLLILCARDLPARGAIVMWEGVLRLAAGGVMVFWTRRDITGTMSPLRPAFDLIVGAIYVVGLPIALAVSPFDLLFDHL
jgi:hypothetical protein